VNKAFDKVMSEINKSIEKALNDNYIDKDTEKAKNKQKRKFSIVKDIGHEYVYNLEEMALHNRDVTEEYVKFFLRELKENSKTSNAAV
ncbi:28376_t:CDS:2, partial [Dentiscutata erythropus]